MRKRPITGPFRMMLIIAILDAALNCVILSNGVIRYWPLWKVVLLLVWPLVLLAETWIYWRVRYIIYVKRNRRRAWVHIVCMFLAFLILPWVRAYLIVYSYRLGSSAIERNLFVSSINKMEPFILWAMIILGHLFFVLMLRNAFAPPLVAEEDPDNVNLLDDVLN